MSNKPQRPFGTTIIVSACFLLCLAMLGLGYWLGERGAHPGGNAVAAAGMHSPLETDPARLNPSHPAIPADATPEMKEFLQNQATLSDKMEEMRNKAPNGAMTPQMFAQFQQQNADLIQRQRQLSQIIAQQQQGNNKLATPQPARLAPGVSPQMQAYLTARDNLMRDQIAFMNQHATDSLAAKEKAMDQWRKQNADRFQQLQKMAQALAPAQTNTPTKPPTPQPPNK